MAIIGCLGEIPFEVSSNTVQTFNNMRWSGSARYSTHYRHLKNALTEFTGLTPDKILFDIILNAHLGSDPMAELVKLWGYERNGTAVGLAIGDKGYGKYRWNVISHTIKMQTFDGKGGVSTATVTVQLQEYLKS